MSETVAAYRFLNTAHISHEQIMQSQFTNGTFNLDAFRNELKTFHKETYWGGHTPGFLMELNKLASNHVASNPEIETHIRLILTGLDTQNVGQRIEQFYQLLLKERAPASVLLFHNHLAT